MDPWIAVRIVAAFAVIAVVLAGLRAVMLRLLRARFALGSGRGLVEVVEMAPLPHENALAIVRVGERRLALVIGRSGIASLGDVGP